LWVLKVDLVHKATKAKLCGSSRIILLMLPTVQASIYPEEYVQLPGRRIRPRRLRPYSKIPNGFYKLSRKLSFYMLLSGGEGFRGVSQSLGHHIANDAIRDWVFPHFDKAKKENKLTFEPGPYDVALIGDYNISYIEQRSNIESINLSQVCDMPKRTLRVACFHEVVRH
jgi:hypothetical protein